MNHAPRFVPALAFALLVTAAGSACTASRPVAQDEPAPEPLTEAGYYGTYALYMGGMTITPGQPAPLTAEWTENEFVVRQGGTPTIRTGIAIDPARGEIRIWDAATGDVRCAAEGLYAFEDDGELITLTLLSDPCPQRRDSADGARLVRRTDGLD